jgi:hypothetical protein
MKFMPRHRFFVLAMAALCLLVLTGCSIEEESRERIEAIWATSPHADAESGAFTHWDDEDPPEVPANCAKCHSTPGYQDFLGLDGATPGQVDHPVSIGTTVECAVCHNDVTQDKHSSVMPSGIELTDLRKNATCMDCHQGRASTFDVEAAIAGLDADVVDGDLGFINIHAGASGPSQYGAEAKGGYEYAGQSYVGRFGHAIGSNTCVACHNHHSLEINSLQCATCHIGATTAEARRDIRMSNVDYDGDGDIAEGIADEISTMQDRLLAALQGYAENQDDTAAIAYTDSFPYFADDQGEQYATWTPRMLQAAYNFHYSVKDTGGFAHNPEYHIQLLYDSLADLGVETAAMTRP